VALLTPVAKAWCTDLGVELSSLGLQVQGGMGYVEETGAAQFYRDSRITPIYEGTNGVQAIDLVARKLPMDGGAVVRSFLDEIGSLDVPLAAAGETFAIIRSNLDAAQRTLRAATEWMLAQDDPNDVLAGATPYLKMFGTVAGGYYTARMALAAATAAVDDPWLQAKIDVARFYAEQLLPQAGGQASAATAGATSMFAIAPDTLEPAR
jgi:hypothetical protein